MKSYLAALSITLALAACGNAIRPKSPDNFVDFTSNTYYELEADIKYNEKRGIGVKWEEGIRAGKYIAKFQDESGYYFIGPDNAICQAFTSCESFNINGGIWISKKSPTDIRIFAIMDPSPAEREAHGEYGAIVQLIIMSGYGKARFFPQNNEFSAKIQRTAKQH